MSYLSKDEKKAIAPDSTKHIKQVWYAQRNKVVEKMQAIKKDDVLKEVLIVLTKIYFEIKKPK